jgi:membrane-bound ClpP family serine protease
MKATRKQKRTPRLSLYVAAAMLLVIAAIVMRPADTFHVAVGVLLIVAAASIILGALLERRPPR